MKDFWNNRYAKQEFAYGKGPNLFFKEELDKMNAGIILFPAEGEGRNAVYAALQGWEVRAFDNSEQGKKKALKLASEMNVSIVYDVVSVEEIEYSQNFDCIVLVFAHFPKNLQQIMFEKAKFLLKVGGKLIVEAYNVNQLPNKTGGPQEAFLMYDLDELKTAFSDFKLEKAENFTLELNEGLYHNGKSDVVRFVAVKA